MTTAKENTMHQTANSMGWKCCHVSAITTAALVLSSSSCPDGGAIVPEELDEELSKCFYKVVSSSKSAQGVGVASRLV